VAKYPKPNSGAIISSFFDMDAADAAISAVALDRLGCRVGLVSNDVGNDPEGRALFDRFGKRGIVTTVTLLDDVSTPFALTVVDREATRTWFTFYGNSVESLLAADLRLVRQADMLYVDLYPETWQAGIRAIDYATELQVPVYANLCIHNDQVCRRLQHRVSVIQTSAEDLSIEQARAKTQALHESYAAPLCLLTMGRHGVVYANRSGSFHLPAHPVQVVSTCGAGAVFSAGMVYGRAQSWSDDKTVVFANALAALYCSTPDGVSSSSAADVMAWASSRGLRCKRLC
jgi:sugar/nucleoside kinase (ribokinase family)